MSLLTIFVLGALTPGHDAVHGYISTIGVPGEPYKPLYVLGGGISAALHLFFLARLARATPPTFLGASALTLLSSFFILHFTAAAAFPCAQDCNWSTVGSRIHYSLGFAAFVAVTIGTLLFAIDAHRQGQWRDRRWIHAASAAMLVGAIGLLITDLLGQYHGIMERAVAIALGLWMATTAIVTWPTRST